FSQSFVPVFAEYDQQRTREDVQALADKVAGTLGLVLFVFTAIGVVAAPVLIGFAGAGWLLNPDAVSAEKYDLAVEMLRFTFPYLLFVSLTALAGAILNTYQRFAAAAFAPVLLNVVLIVFAAWVAPNFEQPGIVLAIGVFVAGVVQLLFMLPSLARVRMLPRPRWGWRDEGVQRIAKLMLPAIFGSSVAQINILFDTLLASFLVTGSISWLYYSDRLMEFPLGVFGIALATVILPNLSREFASKSTEGFAAMLDWALRIVIVIALPSAVGLFMLAGPALTTIFYGGRFTVADVDMATISLMAYSFGLLGFILVKVLAPGYFARQDTKTPVRIGIIALVANMGLNVAFVVPWYLSGIEGAHAGLALATSCSSFLNAGLLYRGLRRDGVIRHRDGWGKFLVRVTTAVAVMAMLLSYTVPQLPVWLESDLLDNVGRLTIAVVGGALVYIAVLFATGIRPHMLRLDRNRLQ
ncbi:MAG: murein biosynthesis integral membrane protein MurJ, partial [Gammaproteobacteria bacterium]|nr:murein biosynthesis integral membrane protein MurJ [Gammaproteobacteria bacterium]